MLQKHAKPLSFILWNSILFVFSFEKKYQVRQLLVEILYFLKAGMCRCMPWCMTHHTMSYQWILWDSNYSERKCQHPNSTRPLVLRLVVLNGQDLNSMTVFKACTFLCHTKTVQLRLLLCGWHGVKIYCYSLGLHLSSKYRTADVMPANHLLTLQIEVLWVYVWKIYQIWYHAHQGNLSLDSPLEALSAHTLAKPLYLWLQWFTPTFP